MLKINLKFDPKKYKIKKNYTIECQEKKIVKWYNNIS